MSRRRRVLEAWAWQNMPWFNVVDFIHIASTTASIEALMKQRLPANLSALPALLACVSYKGGTLGYGRFCWSDQRSTRLDSVMAATRWRGRCQTRPLKVVPRYSHCSRPSRPCRTLVSLAATWATAAGQRHLSWICQADSIIQTTARDIDHSTGQIGLF